MRKQICSVALAIGFLPVFADGYDYLWLHSSSEASPSSYALDDVQKITFGAETMNLHLLSQSSPVVVGYGSSIKITFENEPAPTAVKDIAAASGINICYDAATSAVNVKSPVPMKAVSVYNAQGIHVVSFGQDELSATTSIGSLPTGIYIVRADNGQETKTFKIVKH